MGNPCIKGYKPLFRYQQLPEDEVIIFLNANKIYLENQFQKVANEKTTLIVKNIDFEKIIDSAPAVSSSKYKEPNFLPIKINYLAKEQDNRLLGEKGEQLVFEYKKWRCAKAGKNNLADRLEWVSKEKGDGLGYDILLKKNNGSDRYIEVKTTKLPKETAIYLSHTELAVATIKEK